MNHRFGWAFPDADLFMMNEISPSGDYQRGHLDVALGYVTDWSIALDGGAHVGTFSKVLSSRFARVIAVEPSADTREALAINLATFGCHNVEVKAVALGAAPGRVHMELEGRGIELKNTGARFVQPGGDIPVETIDSWGFPSLGFLKLDIEGSEAAALRGALETLQRCRPIVIIEEKGFGCRFGEPKEAAAAVLTGAGYRMLERVGCDRIWGPA